MARSLYTGSELIGRSFERILLIKPSSLGDIVHALPVLHGLRTRYPGARIDWLVTSTFAALLEGHPQIDEIIRFDRRRFGRVGTSPRVTREFLRFTHDLRRRRYDLVVDLQGLFRTGFLSRATGAGVRIGFRDARERAWMFYTHRVRIDDPDAHAVDRNLSVTGLLGIEKDPIEFNLALPQALRTETEHWLRGLGVGDDKRVVAVVPGARWETKVWLPERFVETIDALHRRDDLRCVLVGGKEDVSLCRRIARECRSEPVNLAGLTDVPRLAAVVALADVVLCHDSAATHLAVALDRPLVCLVGPTNAQRTGPYCRPQDVVSLGLDCAPCYFRRLSQCPHNHRCMRELGSDAVLSAVERVAGRSPLAKT